MIELPTVRSKESGVLTVVENGGSLPFDVRRVYYMYGVPGNRSRGGHAHKHLHQMIVAAAGSFKVTLYDGKDRKTYDLDRPDRGLFVHSGIWNDLFDFSPEAVCMVLASTTFDPEDYLSTDEEYNDFLAS